MYKIFLSLISLLSLNIVGMEPINGRSVSTSHDVRLWSNKKDLFLEDDNAVYRIERYNMNPLLKEVMERQKLDKFIDGGYIRVKQLSDGKYALEAKVRGDGGFLLTGVIVYNAVKYTGYAAIGVAAGGAVVTGFVTGGPVGAATAYTAALAAIPPAVAGVESGALVVGTAASFIPGLP